MLVLLELSVRSFIAFAKLVYPHQLLYSAKRDYKVNEASQALVNLSARSRLSGQLETKHSFLQHLVLTLKLKKYELLRRERITQEESASSIKSLSHSYITCWSEPTKHTFKRYLSPYDASVLARVLHRLLQVKLYPVVSVAWTSTCAVSTTFHSCPVLSSDSDSPSAMRLFHSWHTLTDG
jgi:hypothetical protein